MPKLPVVSPVAKALRATMVVLALLGASPAWSQLQRDAKAEPNWEKLTGCRLVTNQVVDGDSFHVIHKGREYVFRLYFVDAPESDPTLKERITEQAEDFGIAAHDVPRAGRQAARFTREKLTGRNITITTRWRNALGRSSLSRYYAMVEVDGENLAEELVAHGWARIKGLRANWPDGPRASLFIAKLKNLERTARDKHLGVWDAAAFPPKTADSTASTTTNRSSLSATPEPVRVDVNTGTLEELLRLPGIGPKLAESIIAHRPYRTLDDLDAVPGIGPATIKRLEPLIHISSSKP